MSEFGGDADHRLVGAPSVPQTIAEAADPFTDLAGIDVPRRIYWGRWIAAILIAGGLAALVQAVARGQIQWSIVGQFLAMPVIIHGIVATVAMAVAAMVLGILLGLLVAAMSFSGNIILQAAAAGYTGLFRSTPVILQLMLWFNLSLVFPTIGLPGLWSARTAEIMTPFLAALLGLGVNQGAYTAEVIRTGLLSVDAGQWEAAKAIGMGRLTTLHRIILPQAMRVIIPSLGNEFIGMVKITSLASVIQYPELLHSAKNVYHADSRLIELLIVAGFWYLAIVSMLTPLQILLQRRFERAVPVIK